MLLPDFLFYVFDFLLCATLAYDTIGYIVHFNKNGRTNPDEYSRLVFTWILKSLICCASCCLCCLPIPSEVFLGLKVYIMVPAIGGANKIKNLVLDDGFVKGLCARFGVCGAEVQVEAGAKKEN